ncbi:MAG: hypothetical protein ACRDCE_09470 [Cetobacterium sp.]|uniref:hypothetical protein n=1 Tax=Cetobacterium sp. TaxID=2071632 RepID=UPI003EE42F3E
MASTTVVCLHSSIPAFAAGLVYTMRRENGKLWVFCPVGVAHEVTQKASLEYHHVTDDAFCGFERNV